MSVLIITTIDLSNSLTQRPHHTIRYLKNKGIKVTVLSASFENSGEVRDITEENVRYITISLRFLDTFDPRSMYIPFSRVDNEQYDVCMAIGPWAGMIAIILKRQRKINKLVYEDVDYFPAFFDYDIIYERVRQMEKTCLTWADIVVCVSEELVELRRYQTNTPVYFIPNGVDLGVFKEKKAEESESTLDDEIGVDAVDLIYSGALEDWAGVEFVIRGMRELIKILPDIKLAVLGKGSKGNMLFQLVKDLSLENSVRFYGTVKYDELPRYFKNARIGIAVLKPVELIRYAFPLKVVEYMAAGLPVIATDIGDMGRILKKNGAGIAINYSQAEFVEAACALLNDKELYKKCSENARKTSKKYDWNCLFDEEFDIIDI